MGNQTTKRGSIYVGSKVQMIQGLSTKFPFMEKTSTQNKFLS